MVMVAPAVMIPAKSAEARDYIMRDHIVLDLRFGIEWLRCSVGQVWDGKTCSGEIKELNHEEIEKAIVLANEQLGGNWRLPTLEELEALVCMTCQGVKIDRKAFPNTDKSPYWTSEVNALAPAMSGASISSPAIPMRGFSPTSSLLSGLCVTAADVTC